MYLKKVLQGKTVDFEISHKDRIFEINASPLHGRVQSKWMLVVVHDITTVKETETGLIKALEKEQELGELKSRFITMASHEFRTPLLQS
jgi:signal transduction histidine kinase